MSLSKKIWESGKKRLGKTHNDKFDLLIKQKQCN